MKAAKKPVSNAEEAYTVPKSLGSRFARMFLPAPWIEEVPVGSLQIKRTLLERLRDGVMRLTGHFQEEEKQYRLVRVRPGTELTDFYGCSYHIAKDGSLRLGVHHETLPDELLDDDGKPLRGSPRRRLLRAAKIIVQGAQRSLRIQAARGNNTPGAGFA